MRRWMIATTAAAAAAAMLGVTGGAAFGQAQDDGVRVEQFRRVVIDVTGVPPTPGQINAFVADDRVEAHRRWLDGLIVAQAKEARPGDVERLWAPVNPTAADVRATRRAAVKKEKVTYLGVVTSPAQAAMREQLKLPRGVGLVVDVVEGQTAAEAAGVKQHDVIEKLNDQLVINSEQLTALLRGMKAGEEVTLSVVRQGERQTINVKLGEKEIDAGAGDGNVINFTPAPPAPDNRGVAHTWVVDQNFAPPATVGVWNGGGGGAGAGGVMMAGAPATFTGNVIVQQIDGKRTTEWADDQVRISIERDGDKTTNVTMSDAKTGKAMFTGAPPPADDALFKARPELAEKLAKAQEAAAAKPMRFVIADRIGPGLGGARGKVVRWQDAEHVMVLRVMGNQPIYLLALSKKDGRTIYDGPVMSDEQRKGLPAEVAEQFELIAGRPDLAREFGAAEPKEKEKK